MVNKNNSTCCVWSGHSKNMRPNSLGIHSEMSSCTYSDCRTIQGTLSEQHLYTIFTNFSPPACLGSSSYLPGHLGYCLDSSPKILMNNIVCIVDKNTGGGITEHIALHIQRVRQLTCLLQAPFQLAISFYYSKISVYLPQCVRCASIVHLFFRL